MIKASPLTIVLSMGLLTTVASVTKAASDVRPPASAKTEPASDVLEPRLKVTADQKVTVVGHFDSLRLLLTELCDEAGVELRSYDASDRSVDAEHENQPLSKVFERLLAEENYLLGVRGGTSESPATRVAWIRITGNTSPSATAVPRATTAPAKPIAPKIASSTEDDQDRVFQIVAQNLMADEAQLAEFLKAPPRDLAASLIQYPNAAELLGAIRKQQTHPNVVGQLDALIAELTSLNSQSQP